MIKLFKWFKPFAGYFLVVYAIAVITVSSIPDVPTLKIHTHRAEIRLDYLLHFCEYGILTLLAFLTFSGNDFKLNGKKYYLMASGLILFAVLDEFHQKLIPGRSFNVFDMVSNVLGIISALVLVPLFLRIWLRKVNRLSEILPE
jgi:VanZ family protein